MTSTSTTNTTVPGAVSNDNAADPPTIADGEECDGNQNVQNSAATGESDSQPSTNETTTTTTTTVAATIANSNADQPQQQQHPPKRSSSGTKLPAHLSCELNQNVLRRNLKHIKSECALLLRQVSKVREDNRKSDDSVVAKVKYDELEGEVSWLGSFRLSGFFMLIFICSCERSSKSWSPGHVRMSWTRSSSSAIV